MNSSESRAPIHIWITALVIYLAAYSSARYSYGFTGTKLPRRCAVAGTWEGEAVLRMKAIFAPVLWAESWILENDAQFFILSPAI